MSRSPLTPLIDILADLYPIEEGSRRVVDEAGVPSSRIAFQDAAVDNWHAILVEAARRKMIEDVVAVARDEYPERADLAAALEQYLAAPELPEDDSEDWQPAGPYLRNLTLLAATVVTLPWWFYLHLYPLLERALALGALGAGLAVGLVAAWKLISAFTGTGWRSAGRSRLDRALHHPLATAALALALLLVLGLAGATTSIYVFHDDPRLDELAIAVDTRRGDEPRPFGPRPRIETTPVTELVGGPAFFRAPGETLGLRVERPLHLELRQPERRLWPWRRLELRASRDLQLRRRRIARVVPGSGVLSLLPEPGPESPARTYSLEVVIGDASPFVLPDLRQGVVYLGGSRELLEAFRRRESADARHESLTQCLSTFESAESLMPFWNSGHQLLATPELPADGTLSIRLRQDPITGGLTASPPVIKSEETVQIERLSDERIDSICLQRVLT